jgi:hypothetical protein
MDKASKLITEFLLVDPNSEVEDEAFASTITHNPTVTWTKFVLVDDQPNANKQRVPEEEFENLIKTGVFMPIKMAEGKINDGHDGARPIGVITHLKRFKNQILGLAALWSREHPDDVEYIKQAYASGKQLQLSWEILFSEPTVADGIEELRNTTLRAVTLVGLPSYSGRTPILEVASKKTNEEEESMEELEQLRKDLADLKLTLAEKETLLSGKDVAISSKDEELATLKSERDSLAEFKATIDKQRDEAEKLQGIKVQFKEAGLEKDDEYFEKNKSMLLSFEQPELDFFMQEVLSFKPANETEASRKEKNPGAPVLNSNNESTDPKALAEYLRKEFKK